jgi:hypothetical protein
MSNGRVCVFRFSGILSHFIDDVRFFFNFRPELFLKVIVIIDRGNRMGNDDDDDVLFHPRWGIRPSSPPGLCASPT